jgi:predicted dehydrogenase
MSEQRYKIVRAAVVGGGAFGEVHLRTLYSMPQVEVGGVYTLDRARGQELCKRYGGRNYQSLESVGQDSSLDLVIIATPEHSHLEPFQVLAAHGKAIYVEKPLATSLAQAKEILDLSSSVLAMSGHCLRFEARLAQVFERLQSVPKYHLSFRDRRTRNEKEIYSRTHPIYVLLCHEIELSNAFAQSLFKRVVALPTQFSEGQVDGITILIEYENGVTSSIDGGWFLPGQKNCTDNDFVSIVSGAGVDELSLPQLDYFRLDGNGMETAG